MPLPDRNIYINSPFFKEAIDKLKSKSKKTIEHGKPLYGTLGSGNDKGYVFSIRGLEGTIDEMFRKMSNALERVDGFKKMQTPSSRSKTSSEMVKIKRGDEVYYLIPKLEMPPRVSYGAQAQEKVKKFIERLGGKNVRSAGLGSQDPDIRFDFGSRTNLQIEIKTSFTFGEISFFDKTVASSEKGVNPVRDSAGQKELDDLFVEIFGENIEEKVRGDPRFKYADDTNRSGYINIEVPSNKKKDVTNFIKKHWRNSKDNLFIVTNRVKNEALIYKTGFGNEELNELEKAILKNTSGLIGGISTFGDQHVQKYTFGNYGSTRKGTLRLKVSFIPANPPLIRDLFEEKD